MYIVAIAWLYVLMLVSVMQPTIFRGIVTFLGAGLFPLALFLYLVGTPQRLRNRDKTAAEGAQQLSPQTPDSTDSTSPPDPPDLRAADAPAPIPSIAPRAHDPALKEPDPTR